MKKHLHWDEEGQPRGDLAFFLVPAGFIAAFILILALAGCQPAQEVVSATDVPERTLRERADRSRPFVPDEPPFSAAPREFYRGEQHAIAHGAEVHAKAVADAERQAALDAERDARQRRAAVVRPASGGVSASTGPVVRDVWWALALCESGGRNVNTGNGYHGYFQFLPSTWRSVGGTGLPHEHSYETQRHFAQVLQARSGWGQWPSCSRRLGLR